LDAELLAALGIEGSIEGEASFPGELDDDPIKFGHGQELGIGRRGPEFREIGVVCVPKELHREFVDADLGRILPDRSGIGLERPSARLVFHVVARLGPGLDDAPHLEKAVGLEYGGKAQAVLDARFAERGYPAAFGKGPGVDLGFEIECETFV
jgi:hypothetical protein